MDTRRVNGSDDEVTFAPTSEGTVSFDAVHPCMPARAKNATLTVAARGEDHMKATSIAGFLLASATVT